MTIRVLVLLALLIGGCDNSALDDARSLANQKKPTEALKKYEEALRTQPEQASEIIREADDVVKSMLIDLTKLFQAKKYAEVVKLAGPMKAVRTTQREVYLYDGLSRVAAAPMNLHEMEQGLSSLNRYLRLEDKLAAEMTYPRYVLGQLMQIHRAQVGSQNTKAIKHFFDDLKTPFATSEDTGYVMRMLLYRRIVRGIVGQSTDPTAVARALFDWLVRNTQLKKGAQPDLSLKPLCILVRGFGLSGRLAWAYIALARQAGLPAVLRLEPVVPKDDEARPQSKAVLRYDFFVAVGTGDTWRTFDPRRGLEIDLPYTGKTVLLMVGEPRGYYPRMRILEDLLRKHLSSDAPSLFVAPDRTVQLLLQRFQQRKLPRSGRAKLVFPVKAKGRPSVDLWSHPFAVDQRYRWDKTFKKQKREQLAVVKLYEIARVMQLESQYFSAAEKYAFAINKIKHPGALRDCSFFRAVCLQEEGQLETALVAFQKHLADHQDSPWKTLIQIRMGECYAKLGQKADALAAWGRVAGPRAAASAKLSQSLEK